MITVAVAGCGVTRAPIDERSDPAALPNLRRASQALQERIVREKEHVRDLNQQLSELLASEAQVYSEVFEAEAAYQQLRSDADAVQGDVAAIEAELGQLRQTLETRTVELEAARTEAAALVTALAVERQAGLEARRGIGFWRGGVEADGSVSTRWRDRLAAFREEHGIPHETWTTLLSELGLSRLVFDPAEPVPPATSEVLPPDSLPPPGAEAPATEEAAVGAESAADDATVDPAPETDPGDEPGAS